MNKAYRYRTSNDIVKIRGLQWEQARHHTLHARAEVARTDENLQLAREAALACATSARQSLIAASTLSPQLMVNWMHAANAAQNHLRQCLTTATDAQTELQNRMQALQRQQEQLDEAQRLAKRFKRDYDRQVEEKRASAIEDSFLSRGVRR